MFFKKRMNIKVNKGFSLLEIVLVIAVALIMITSALVMYPKIQSNQRANNEAKNVAAIKAGVRALYKGKATYTGLTNTILVESRSIPDNMTVPGDTSQIISSYGSPMRIYASDFGTSKAVGSSFTIIYMNITNNDCAKLVPLISGEMSAIQINTLRVKALNEPVDAKLVADACAQSDNNQINLSSL